jgi:hypothetical protein
MYEERHGCIMDSMTHRYNHLSRGTQAISGMVASGWTIGTDTLAAVSIAVSNGTIADEDIFTTISGFDTDPASIPVFYREGATGIWNWTTPQQLYFRNAAGGNNRVAFNEFTGGVWTQTEATNNNFVNCWILATPDTDPTYRIIAIQGQAQYTSLALAQAATFNSNVSIGAFPSAEFVPLYRITLQTNTGWLVAAGRARVQGVTDIRGATGGSAAASGAGTHGSLAGRSDPNSHPATAISAVPPTFGLDPTVENNVELALDRLSEFTFVGTWTTGKAYRVGNVVIESGIPYRCISAHTSTTFATDLAVPRWVKFTADSINKQITQNSHGFVIGNVLYLNGSTYTKSKADLPATAEVVGVVSRVVDTNTFMLCGGGNIAGLSGLTAGTVYFLSDSTAGLLTATEPTTIGNISKPLLIADSTTSGYFYNFRGVTVGATNAKTTIGLANNAATTILDVSTYNGGRIEGELFIDGTADTKAWYELKFIKSADGKYYGSSSFVGDTLLGVSLAVTDAGMVQFTLPSVTGFASASYTYTLNGPAVGATFPLAIGANNIIQDGSSAIMLGYSSQDANVTMTNTSANIVRIASPSTQRTVTLPTTGIKAGYVATILVDSATETNYVLVNSSGGNEIDRIGGDKGEITVVALQDTPTTAAHWRKVRIYEDITVSVDFIGVGAGTGAANLTGKTLFLTRINNQCHIAFGDLVLTTGTGAAADIQFSALPTRFRPVASPAYIPCFASDTGAWFIGILNLGTSTTNFISKPTAWASSTAGIGLKNGRASYRIG